MTARGPVRSALVLIALCACLGLAALPLFFKRPPVRTGSKAFTESVILGEMLAILSRAGGADADHRHSLSGTQVAWRALLAGEIDAYVEYAGTIRKEILTGRDLPTAEALGQALAEQGILMSRPLGFNNSYAIGMKKEVAARLSIRKISDLGNHADLRLGFTSEFLDRTDGWPGLRKRYQLPQTNVKGMEHALAYASLQAGSIDAMDLYSTDAKIKLYDLQVLADDRHYFPNYDAVVLYRAVLESRLPQVVQEWRRLEGRISEADMQEMNSQVESKKMAERLVAADFLVRAGLLSADAANQIQVEGLIERSLRHAGEHLFLVALSLSAAILVALPLGILAAY